MPTAAPDQAAAELERTVRDYNFKGAMINGHIRGRYLDDNFFWPILARAEALDVPIYIHPTPPPQAVIDASYGPFPQPVTDMLAGAGWGWHIETAIHVIRMILGGVFDAFPKLQVVVGHMGEALPFMLPRLDNLSVSLTKLNHPVTFYLRQNVHDTFSGFNFTPTFLDLFLEVGVDRIMFSADHPYASMSQRAVPRSVASQLLRSGADCAPECGAALSNLKARGAILKAGSWSLEARKSQDGRHSSMKINRRKLLAAGYVSSAACWLGGGGEKKSVQSRAGSEAKFTAVSPKGTPPAVQLIPWPPGLTRWTGKQFIWSTQVSLAEGCCCKKCRDGFSRTCPR